LTSTSYTLSLHDALPISDLGRGAWGGGGRRARQLLRARRPLAAGDAGDQPGAAAGRRRGRVAALVRDADGSRSGRAHRAVAAPRRSQSGAGDQPTAARRQPGAVIWTGAAVVHRAVAAGQRDVHDQLDAAAAAGAVGGRLAGGGRRRREAPRGLADALCRDGWRRAGRGDSGGGGGSGGDRVERVGGGSARAGGETD